MRKLLNTLYVTNANAYLSLEQHNVVCTIEGAKAINVPLLNIESIVCFSYLGCSPALMGACVANQIPINFISPTGKFLAKIVGETKGNVLLRVRQLEVFDNNAVGLARNGIVAKIANCIMLIKRSMHDYAELRTDTRICSAIEQLQGSILSTYSASDIETLVGIEGNAAHAYFGIFDMLIRNEADVFNFCHRTKRPPLDAVNAVLSFMYTILTSEYASALETVGLDSYIGFCHTLRSGRASLACDLVEEARFIVERFVLGLINLRVLSADDFDFQPSGVVYLNADGRKKVLSSWQEKKRTVVRHSYLKQNIQLGLLPYVQSNLLAKYVRGDIGEYPVFLSKKI